MDHPKRILIPGLNRASNVDLPFAPLHLMSLLTPLARSSSLSSQSPAGVAAVSHLGTVLLVVKLTSDSLTDCICPPNLVMLTERPLSLVPLPAFKHKYSIRAPSCRLAQTWVIIGPLAAWLNEPTMARHC